jgi:hypothetical protein
LQYVLEKAIRTIDAHVDTSALRRMPEAYRDIISSGVGPWDRVILPLLDAPNDPDGQLKRLSPLLVSNGARLVIVIEDLERNTSSEFDPQHIQSMLQRFRTVEGVSFMLVGRPRIADKRFDYQKLCDHIENIPNISPSIVRVMIETLREFWLTEYHDIDPAPNRARKPVRGIEEQPGWPMVDIDIPWKSIANLIRTPRALKHLLRNTNSACVLVHRELEFLPVG